jgi:hypothetical protein
MGTAHLQPGTTGPPPLDAAHRANDAAMQALARASKAGKTKSPYVHVPLVIEGTFYAQRAEDPYYVTRFRNMSIAQMGSTLARRASLLASLVSDAIAAVYRGAAVAWLGEDASENRLKKSWPNFDVFHVATHGVFLPADPMRSHLLLSGGHEDDGLLEVNELFNLRTSRAPVVVFSACKTQLGTINAGDDIIGFNRALYFGGVPTMITSLWSVSDEATAHFMASFHASLATGSTPQLNGSGGAPYPPAQGCPMALSRPGAAPWNLNTSQQSDESRFVHNRTVSSGRECTAHARNTSSTCFRTVLTLMPRCAAISL